MWKTFEIVGFCANRKGAEKIKSGDSVKKFEKKRLRLAWGMAERPKCAEYFVTWNSVCHLWIFLKTEIMGGLGVADMKRKGT